MRILGGYENETDRLTLPRPINLDVLDKDLAERTGLTAATEDLDPFLGEGLTKSSESPVRTPVVRATPRDNLGDAQGEPPPTRGEGAKRGIFLAGEGELPVACCSSSN